MLNSQAQVLNTINIARLPVFKGSIAEKSNTNGKATNMSAIKMIAA
jgi:hypothetical protein